MHKDMKDTFSGAAEKLPNYLASLFRTPHLMGMTSEVSYMRGTTK